MNKIKALTISATLLALLLTGCNSKKNDSTQDNDKYDYVLLAQPVVSAVLSQKSNFKVSNNVQTDYKAKSNNLEITQASIFVKSDLEETKVNSFLAMIKNDLTTLMASPDTVLPSALEGVEEQLISSKLGGKLQLITNLLKNGDQIGLGYKEALANKASIDAFIGTLGMPATTEEKYYSISEAEASTSLNLKVAVPAGAPATAFYNHLKDSNLEVAAADTVLAYLDNSSNKDVVIAPTNAGLAAINKGLNMKLAATITFGNFFVVSTGNDNNDVMDKGDKVLAFQENGVGGKLFKYVYGDRELDITYVKDAAAVKNIVLTEDY